MERRSRQVAVLLETFAAGHPGVRLGRCFGEPAVFAGRRVAIRGAGAEVALRLAPAGRDRAMTLCPGRVRRWHNGWLYLSAGAGRPVAVTGRSASAGTDRSASAVASLFEHAVHHVASA